MIAALLVLTLAALAVVAFAVAFEVCARRDRAARRSSRRGARIEADRAALTGEEPLPPGTDVNRAYAYAARHDLTVREAALELWRRETRGRLRRRLDPHPLD